MEKKQTAVQWLQQKIKEQGFSHYFSINELINQALQMEREQIEEAFQDGCMQGDYVSINKSEYYEETFKP